MIKEIILISEQTFDNIILELVEESLGGYITGGYNVRIKDIEGLEKIRFEFIGKEKALHFFAVLMDAEDIQ